MKPNNASERPVRHGGMRRLDKILLWGAYVGAFSVVAAWWSLMGTICSAPTVASPTTDNTVPYNCHGAIVFITPLQEGLRAWLVPVGFLFVVLAYVARKRAI